MSHTMSDLWHRPASLPLLLLFGSGGALLGALFFQYIVGLAPCELCYDQRYAHVAVLVPAALSLFLSGLFRQLLLGVAGLALLASAGLAGYHIGVEQGWWASGCSAPAFDNLDIGQLRAALEATPVVRCDEVPWSFLGISMAGYNFLLSLGLAVVTLGSVGGRFWRSA
ncbi:MAG TPA: disulfide bond formation protein B [Kiloniellales bacterium]|jgi:disulfide bond formation protein DsbB|nr:disulfide bond formation protein B [Kiloniellales bacterium]